MIQRSLDQIPSSLERGVNILMKNTWDLIKKEFRTYKKLRFQSRGQLNEPFSDSTYLYINLTEKIILFSERKVYLPFLPDDLTEFLVNLTLQQYPGSWKLQFSAHYIQIRKEIENTSLYKVEEIH